MARVRLAVITPLPREDCLRRLQEQIDPEGSVFGKRPVIGRVRDRSLRLRKRIAGRNSFQTFLYAGLVSVGSHTRFDCRFGMHPAVIAFMAFWFGVLLFGAGGVAAELVGRADADGNAIRTPLAVFGPLAMIVLGLVVVAIGRYGSKGDVAFLTEFLLGAVEGRIEAPPVVSPARR